MWNKIVEDMSKPVIQMNVTIVEDGIGVELDKKQYTVLTRGAVYLLLLILFFHKPVIELLS